MTGAIRTARAGSLRIEVYRDRGAMGRAAGKAAGAALREVLAARGAARMIFASAPSQDEFLDALRGEPGIDWSKVTAFHMDEYVGLPGTAPQSFGRYIRERLLDRVRPGAVHFLDGTAADAEAECRRYGDLLGPEGVDLACMGIGENGHLAFNDPPVADFEDPRRVKVVELEEACRRQQVNDGCFPEIGAVPRTALTLTLPTLLAAKRIFCVVPGPRKAAAVRRTVHDPVSTACPSTGLRNHPDAVLYLDADSAAEADTALAGR